MSFPCFLGPVFGLVALAVQVFWIWMLVECATKEKSKRGDNTQLIWILIIALTNVLGAVIYFLVRRPERMREFGE